MGRDVPPARHCSPHRPADSAAECVWSDSRSTTKPELVGGVETTMRLLLAKEAAEILRIPQNRVYALGKSGVLPSVRIGRQVRFVEEKLLDWIRKGGSQQESTSSSDNPHKRIA